MQEFKIKAYGKSELALQYFPEAASAHTAVNFTPKEVGKIVEYLGEP